MRDYVVVELTGEVSEFRRCCHAEKMAECGASWKCRGAEDLEARRMMRPPEYYGEPVKRCRAYLPPRYVKSPC